MASNGRFRMFIAGFNRGLLNAETLEFVVPLNRQVIRYPEGYATVSSRLPNISSRVFSQTDGTTIWESKNDQILDLVDSTLLLKRKADQQVYLQHLDGRTIWEEEGINQGSIVDNRLVYSNSLLNLYGMIDLRGNQLLPQIYRSISPSRNRTFWCVKDTTDKQGIFSSDGSSIVPIIYDNVDVKSIYIDQKKRSFFLVKDTSGYSLYDGVGQLINSYPAKDIELVPGSLSYVLMRHEDYFHPYDLTGKQLSQRGLTNLSKASPERYRSAVDALSYEKLNRLKFWATDRNGNTIILDQMGKYWSPEKYFED